MAIVKWGPWHEIEAMERRMRRMLELPFGSMTLPSADVYETDADWVAELEVPGFQEKDLTIEVIGDTVRVTGQREQSTDEQTKTFHMKERLESSFERRFTLPAGADADAITATFDKGVLQIRAARAVEAAGKPKSIEIGTAEGHSEGGAASPRPTALSPPRPAAPRTSLATRARRPGAFGWTT